MANTPADNATTTAATGVSAKPKGFLRHNRATHKSAEQLDAAAHDEVQLRRVPCDSSADDCDGLTRRWRPIGNEFRDRRNSRSAEHIPDRFGQCSVVRSASGSGGRKKSVPDTIHGELLHALLKFGKDSNQATSRSSSTDNCTSDAHSSAEHSDDPSATDDPPPPPTTDDTMMPPLQNHQAPNASVPNGDHMAAGNLIMPKKLINPCLESSDRKNLHRELMFNQKIGKSVLNQKTELQKALEKQKDRQQLNSQLHEQQQSQDQGLSGELGRVIMQRAQRIESLQNGAGSDGENGGDQHQLNPEYLKIRAKLRATDAK